MFFLIGGFQVATQYFACQFNYQDQLGTHFNHLYAPWSILVWSNQWYDQHSGIFDLTAGYGILFSSVGLILVLIVKLAQYLNQPAQESSATTGSCVEPYRDAVAQWVANGVKAKTIYQTLVRNNRFGGSYAFVYWFVRLLKPTQTKRFLNPFQPSIY
ncbi:MAG: hypothetical protein KDE66_07870 [Nitrosomonas sp.]|nr:hypothetical protein [Nitrosomonas sp.]